MTMRHCKTQIPWSWLELLNSFFCSKWRVLHSLSLLLDCADVILHLKINILEIRCFNTLDWAPQKNQRGFSFCLAHFEVPCIMHKHSGKSPFFFVTSVLLNASSAFRDAYGPSFKCLVWKLIPQDFWSRGFNLTGLFASVAC